MRDKLPISPGMTFGRLTVITENTRHTHRAFWCRCACGQIASVNASPLFRGRTRSCGCLAVEVAHRGLKPGEAAFNSLLLRWKNNAEARGYEFTLTRVEALTLSTQDCWYCGQPPSMVKHPPTPLVQGGPEYDWVYNGLDRLDNKKGYTAANVAPSCWPCNRAKAAMPVDRFREWVLRIRAPRPILPDMPTPNAFALKRAKENAAERGLAFDLSDEDAYLLFSAPCAYCSQPPSSGPRDQKYTGIDRLHNSKGYEPDNCVPSCWPCNQAKGHSTTAEFLDWAQRVQACQPRQVASTSTR